MRVSLLLIPIWSKIHRPFIGTWTAIFPCLLFLIYSIHTVKNICFKERVTSLESASFGGVYKKNPFFFQPFDCSSLALYIDGQSYHGKPLQQNNFMEAYRNSKACTDMINISFNEFKRGCTMFVFHIDDNIDFNTKRRGDFRLELRFGSGEPENITLLLYGKFPRVLQIDESRRVYLQWII